MTTYHIFMNSKYHAVAYLICTVPHAVVIICALYVEPIYLLILLMLSSADHKMTHYFIGLGIFLHSSTLAVKKRGMILYWSKLFKIRRSRWYMHQ